MTRINCIPVGELTDKHLVAEYRELPRVFSWAIKRKGVAPVQPCEYVLGEGHVSFFFDKLKWCWERWMNLRDEMYYRNFKPSGAFFDSVLENAAVLRARYPQLWLDWEVTPTAQMLNRERINERNSR